MEREVFICLTFLYQKVCEKLQVWVFHCRLHLIAIFRTKMPQATFLVGNLSLGLSFRKEYKTDSEKCFFIVEQNWGTLCFPFLILSEITGSHSRCCETVTIVVGYYKVLYGLQSKHKCRDYIT